MLHSSILIEFGRDGSSHYEKSVLLARQVAGYTAHFVAGKPQHTVQTRITEAQQSAVTALLESVRHVPGSKVTLNGEVVASKSPAPTHNAATPHPQSGAVPRSSSLDCVEYAVFDVETTGFSSKYHRVVEVAVLVLDSSGEVIDEYCTLVNPNRHMDHENVMIHKVLPAMAGTAPSFDLVADDLLLRMAGRVWVAHNANFDIQMLEAEYRRLGLELPAISSVCTLAHCSRAGLEKGKLSHLCQQVGVALQDAHTALGDARATAKLFRHMLTVTRAQGATTLSDLGCDVPPVPAAQWPQLAYEETTWTREQAEESVKARAVEAAQEITREALHGSTVCLTGEFLHGPRDEAERMLLELGVRLTGSVSRKTTFVFAADVDTLSSKARKARELGIGVHPEKSLWSALGAAGLA